MFLVLMTIGSQHKGSGSPSISILVIDEERLRSSYWLESGALMLLVARQERHLTRKAILGPVFPHQINLPLI